MQQFEIELAIKSYIETALRLIEALELNNKTSAIIIGLKIALDQFEKVYE